MSNTDTMSVNSCATVRFSRLYHELANIVVLRFGDVLLMKAEALNGWEGPKKPSFVTGTQEGRLTDRS